jgi:hypothetical protein
MKASGSGGTVPLFLTSAMNEIEWSASPLVALSRAKKASNTHWIGRFVDPKAVLEAIEKRKVSSLA